MKNHIGSILLILICLFATSAAADNLVPNGNFENGTYVGPNGDLVPNGWTNLGPNNVSQSDVNVLSLVNAATFQGPESGSYYVAFSSPATDGSQDCLFTTLNTVVGQQYTVSFWVALTAAAVGNTNLTPQWDWNLPGTVNMLNSFYYDPTNTGPEGYEEFVFTETANSTETTLMFHGTDANGAILLDNVSVTPVAAAVPPTPTPTPEPSTGALLVTGIAIIVTRKRLAQLLRLDTGTHGALSPH